MSAPESLDLTAAARGLCEAEDGEDALCRQGAYLVWEALTGLTYDEALAYARQVAAARPPITAHVPPM